MAGESSSGTPSIKRVLIPIRPGRGDLWHPDPTLDPRFLEALGPLVEVTLLTVGGEREVEVMTAFLDAVVARYPGRSMQRQVMVADDAASAILEAASGHDLIILGAPEDPVGGPILQAREYRWAGPILGSVVGEVLSRTTVPLMVVWRHAFQESPRQVLVPTDRTAGSDVAVDLARALAAGTTAAVTVLEVDESHTATGTGQPDDIVAVIRFKVTEVGCDLLVLNAHVGSRRSAPFAGDTATELLRNPPCSIALVYIPLDSRPTEAPTQP